MKLKKYYPLLIVLAAVLFYSLVMLPAGDRHSEIVDEIAVKARTLEKYRALIKNAPETDRELKRITGDLGKSGPLIIDAKNDSVGFSKLNSYIQQSVRSAGLELIAIKPQSGEKYDCFMRLPLQITASANIKQLVDFLQNLSSGRYLITLNGLDVTVININQPDRLRVRIDLNGFREL